jgi:hypothetical protein
MLPFLLVLPNSYGACIELPGTFTLNKTVQWILFMTTNKPALSSHAENRVSQKHKAAKFSSPWFGNL